MGTAFLLWKAFEVFAEGEGLTFWKVVEVALVSVQLCLCP